MGRTPPNTTGATLLLLVPLILAGGLYLGCNGTSHYLRAPDDQISQITLTEIETIWLRWLYQQRLSLSISDREGFLLALELRWDLLKRHWHRASDTSSRKEALTALCAFMLGLSRHEPVIARELLKASLEVHECLLNIPEQPPYTERETRLR